MKCPECEVDNTDGNNFCSACGSLLTTQLIPLVRSQVEGYVREHFRDQKVLDVETTEAIALRFQRWSKWFLVPATILVTLLGLILGLIGIRDFSSVHKAAEQAITEANTAGNKAQDATKKAQDAQSKSEAATQSIDAATAKMNAQLASAQQLSAKVSGLENKTADQIADANKHIEARLTELDKRLETANRAIAEQQSKLTSTNELVTAMFSKGQVENFNPAQGDTPTFITFAIPAAQGAPQKGAVVYMLLRSAPIYQTVQINFRIYVQPKSSYAAQGNLLRFFWGDPADNLKQYPLEVSYIPDPTYKGITYSKLSVKDGHIFADSQQLQ